MTGLRSGTLPKVRGVNLAMISYYFGSKEKLLEALIVFRSEYAYGILEELNKDQSLSPWDKIDRLVEFYVDRILNNLRISQYHVPGIHRDPV